MRCPNAAIVIPGSWTPATSTTRPIRRRRECAACVTRFTTYERIESARLVVLKRDGTREDFDRDKLAAGLHKALTRRPVAAGAAEEAADEIETDLRAVGHQRGALVADRRAGDGAARASWTRSPTSVSRASTRASTTSSSSSARSTALLRASAAVGEGDDRRRP